MTVTDSNRWRDSTWSDQGISEGREGGRGVGEEGSHWSKTKLCAVVS